MRRKSGTVGDIFIQECVLGQDVIRTKMIALPFSVSKLFIFFPNILV